MSPKLTATSTSPSPVFPLGLGVDPSAAMPTSMCSSTATPPLPGLPARPGRRPGRCDAAVHGLEPRHVAHAAVDDDACPAVVAREAGDHVPDKRDAARPTAVDHEDTPRAGLTEATLDE